MSASPDVRWKQRFQNFDRAFVLLREAMENGPAALNQLEKEGVIQRFEYCFELAWKTLNDYLEASGFILAAVSPRQIVKQASSAKVIRGQQLWIDMLKHRNLLSHTFDCAVFEDAVEAIHARYLSAIAELHEFFRQEALK